jgi:hypothetical protein
MTGLGGRAPLVVKVSESNAAGVLSPPVVLASNVSDGPEAISLASNRYGERALRYVEVSPPAQPYPVFPFSVDVRIGASGKPLGAARALCSGLLGPTEAPAIECEASRTLVGANGDGFYAVSVFTRELASASPSRVVAIERVTRSSTGPAVQVALPPMTTFSAPREPEPASLVDFGAVARVDSHGRLHGSVTCGNAFGASCSIQITITTTSQPRLIIARARVTLTAGIRTIAVKLRSASKGRLRHGHSISARMRTVTRSSTGSTLQTDYPLTIAAP